MACYALSCPRPGIVRGIDNKARRDSANHGKNISGKGLRYRYTGVLHERHVQGVDVIHFIAAWTLALLFIRGAQALGEHYLPGSGANSAARFLYGGPS